MYCLNFDNLYTVLYVLSIVRILIDNLYKSKV